MNMITTLQGGLRVRVRRGGMVFRDELEVDIYSKLDEGGRDIAAASPLEMKVLTEEERLTYQGPTFTMPEHTAQKLMDDLWDCGLRPSEGTGSAGALAATQKHLEDLKRIAFHALKVKEPTK